MAEYVEQRNGGYYVAGTRVSLDSVVHEFLRGAAPETILRAFPLIKSLEKVYGSITFYLANRPEIDEYLDRQELVWKESRDQSPLPADLKSRLDRAREATPERRS